MMKFLINLLLKITYRFSFGSSIKYRLKKTEFNFETKGWSIGLFEFKEDCIKKKWKPKSELSKVTYKLSFTNGFADPFLIKEGKRTYLFMESIVDGKGEIWVSEIKNKKILNPKLVLKSNFHFSYPNVFREKDEFYLIPETSQNKMVTLYKAEKFPYKWLIKKNLNEGNSFVDTNLLVLDGVYYWFTFDLELKKTRLFFSESLEANWNEHPKSKFDCNRNAGNFIRTKDRILRPVQVSEKKYGEGVALMIVTKISKDVFEEKVYDASFLVKKRGFRLDGVHHISSIEDDRLVVIDGKNNNFYSINSRFKNE
ncbi:glucosamine inositolphosphorylceramide transferase family protein [Flavobacterium adhaerens]|uniref:glucosamine inositolphosphorylceramide transferase family protein n=1 Tax=Flavobacterium adhaerens TaxID=3149043 RepID=UPI0032B4795F